MHSLAKSPVSWYNLVWNRTHIRSKYGTVPTIKNTDDTLGSHFSIPHHALTSPPQSAAREELLEMDARTQESLAFLRCIERVCIPSKTVEDDALFLVLDVHVTMKNQNQLTEKQRKKQSKALRPHVDYSTTKAVKTLVLVHEAIHDWSRKHPNQNQHVGSDDQAPSPMPQHCAYCSQFNSPAAMDLWRWNKPPPPPPQQELTSSEDTPGLSVVVIVNELLEFEKCLNNYVESARNVPEGLDERDCEGLTHIPSIVASFVQRAQIKDVGVSRFGAVCGAGM